LYSFESISQLELDTNYVDTVSIKSSSGFTAEDFIRMTKSDTSFLRAFRNLRAFEHTAVSKVVILDQSNNNLGSIIRKSNTRVNNNVGFTQITEELVGGNYYKKNGEHRYYTTEMFDKVFFPQDSFPIINAVGGAYEQQKPQERSRIEKHYEQLKTFMFTPGIGVDGVPLIGKKLNLFEMPTKELYDFKVNKVTLFDTIPCYEFAVVKKESTSMNDISIEYIYTYYDRRTMQIIQRKYHLIDKTILFDFNIYMDITLKLLENEYVPTKIVYSGEWDIPFNKPERIQFKMLCDF
jgi:hypothetical protein